MDKLKDKKLYYVGGVVRDEILGATSFDTDFCCEGNAIEFAEKKQLNIIKRNPDFGTVRVLHREKGIDIASTRTETYPKAGHLPIVSNIGCPLKDDLKRRDFTINSMAKNTLTGEITDPFGGKFDIEKKQIRVLHNNSFIDDPTRIIRALKFSVRFGFELSEETKKMQEEYLDNINYDMSYHRLKKELTETFNLNSAEAFDRFIEQGIYKLLGKNQKKIDIKGNLIKNTIDSTIYTPWLIYMSFFDLSNIPLTRKEMSILEWAGKLKTQKSNNNTPKESVLIYNLRKESGC